MTPAQTRVLPNPAIGFVGAFALILVVIISILPH